MEGTFRKTLRCKSGERAQIQTIIVDQANTKTDAETANQHQDTNSDPKVLVNFDDLRILAIDKEMEANRIRDRVKAAFEQYSIKKTEK